jgi:isopenicillin N synthase-like dioxygenase
MLLRFPARTATNGKGKKGRGIGSHTDYGLIVIATQDDVGGK